MIYDYLLKYGFKPNNIGLNYLADIINLGIKGENLEPLSRVGYKLIAIYQSSNLYKFHSLWCCLPKKHALLRQSICLFEQ